MCGTIILALVNLSHRSTRMEKTHLRSQRCGQNARHANIAELGHCHATAKQHVFGLHITMSHLRCFADSILRLTL